MAAVAETTCFCGCGRAIDACHGMPRRERRRRARELRALAEAHDVSALFPSVRPHDPVLEAYAERVATELDPRDPRVPTHVIERGVELLDDAEHRRIVDDWARDHPRSWESLCAAAGDVVLVERAFVASAVRGAISERRPLPPSVLAVLEDGSLRRSPAAALGLVLPPVLVWEKGDAIALADASRRGRGGLDERFDAMLERSFELTADEHVDRIRVLTARLESALPVPGLPVASATVADGCALVADDEVARQLAALLLVTYATSLGRRA